MHAWVLNPILICILMGAIPGTRSAHAISEVAITQVAIRKITNEMS